MPNVYKDRKSGLTFTDVAGLGDTGGDLVEIINNFTIKFILLKARSVKFLLPITPE